MRAVWVVERKGVVSGEWAPTGPGASPVRGFAIEHRDRLRRALAGVSGVHLRVRKYVPAPAKKPVKAKKGAR